MKKLSPILLFFTFGKALALTTIYDKDGLKTISDFRGTYFNNTRAASASPSKDNESRVMGIPATSKLKSGVFESYKLSKCQQLSTSFFVVGSDELSLVWLEKHQTHLKEVHALGLATNVDSVAELKKIEALSPIPLMPVKVDILAEVVKAPSYPFFTNGCEVWQ